MKIFSLKNRCFINSFFCLILLWQVFSTHVIFANEINLNCNSLVLNELQINKEQKNPLPTIQGKVNGIDSILLLDSGSNLSYLMPKHAEKLDLFVGRSSSFATGVGGKTSRSVTKVRSIEIPPIRVENPYIFVLNKMGFEPYFDMILGADYLFALDIEINISKGYIKYLKTDKCESKNFIDWDKNKIIVTKTYLVGDDSRPHFDVNLNGKKLSAIIDTAGQTTIIDLQSAKIIGLQFDEKQVDDNNFLIGAGSEKMQFWSAKINSITIDNHEIDLNKINIAPFRSEKDQTTPSLILGLDFLKKYRVLFLKDEQKIYFEKY